MRLPECLSECLAVLLAASLAERLFANLAERLFVSLAASLLALLFVLLPGKRAGRGSRKSVQRVPGCRYKQQREQCCGISHIFS